MTTQRFDIEVRDLVAKSIRSEIEGIASAARNSHNALREMRQEMGQTAAASRGAQSATRSSATATSEHTRESQASARAMRDEARAADQLAASYRQQAAAARSQKQMAGLYGYNRPAKSARASASVFEGAFDAAAAGRATAEQQRFTDGLKSMGRESRLARHHLLNLGFQIQDVGVGLASGQKPLTVFVQQGAQIAGIASQAGVGLGGLAKAAVGMVAPFLPLIAAVGAATAVFALFADEVNEGVDTSELTAGLGLTADEMKELEGVTVTWGDIFLGTWDAAKEKMISATDAMFGYFGTTAGEVWETVVEYAKTGINFMIGSITLVPRVLMATWDKIPAGVADIFLSAANMAISGINFLIQKAVEGINSFIQFANDTVLDSVGLGLGLLGTPQIGALQNDYAGAGRELGAALADSLLDTVNRDFLGDAAAAIRPYAIKRARDRLRGQAGEIADGRGGGGRSRTGRDAASEEEKRGEALAKVNRELDAQLALLSFYGPELERQNRFLTIKNGLLDKGIELTAEEERMIRAKILAIQEGERTQAALTRIEEEALGPQRAYDANLRAITIALQDSIISEAEATRQRNLATTAYQDAIDPMREYRVEIANSARELALYGEELAVFQRARELLERDISAGVTTRDTANAADYTDKARAEYERSQMTRAFEAMDQSGREDPSSSSFILDNYEELYAEIDRLREEDLLKEEEASERKRNLDKALLDARLEYTSSILGQLSTLQNSKSKEVAAFGKAAAIAQATIDGYRAVQAALAGPPGPPWSYAIAGTTAAMTAANVAKIAGVGFMTGGYTGSVARDAPAGIVHGQEYVFDAAATARIGVPALEAMRRGTTLSQPSGAGGNNGPNVVVKPQPGVWVEEVATSDGHIEMIARRITREEAPRAVAADVSASPNSKTSQALATSFGLKRDR